MNNNSGDVSIIITNIEPALRRRMVVEAALSGVSVNELAADALATHYNVDRRPSKQTAQVEHDLTLDRVVVRVPAKVRHKLRQQAARNGATMSGLCRVILSGRVGLQPPSPYRKPRSR